MRRMRNMGVSAVLLSLLGPAAAAQAAEPATVTYRVQSPSTVTNGVPVSNTVTYRVQGPNTVTYRIQAPNTVTYRIQAPNTLTYWAQTPSTVTSQVHASGVPGTVTYGSSAAVIAKAVRFVLKLLG